MMLRMRTVAAALLWLFFSVHSNAQNPVGLAGFPVRIDFAMGLASSTFGPALADLDGDGRMEIIINGESRMYVFRHDGTNFPGWPRATQGNKDLSYSPAVGDIDGDGTLEILSCTIPYNSSLEYDSTYLYAWHSNGESVLGFPRSYGNAFHTPVLYDVDGDGAAEIIMAWNDVGYCLFNRMYVLNGDGSVRAGWPQPMARTGVALQKPAVGDLDGDGIVDIVFPTRVCIFGDLLQIYAWNRDGQLRSGFPYSFPPRFETSNNVVLTPADSLGRRQIVTYGTYLTINPPVWEYSTLVVVLQHDGTVAPGWPQSIESFVYFTQIAIGNFFGNGIRIAVFDFETQVYIWTLTGQLAAQWIGPPTLPMFLVPGQIETSSSVMSLVMDSNQNYGWGTTRSVISAVLAHRADGTQGPWTHLPIRGWTASQMPTFGDINGDGQVDMIVVADVNSVQRADAYVHAFTLPGIPWSRERFPWPTYGHDRWRTSQYGFVPPDSVVVGVRHENALPEAFLLSQNYPNPFNPSTKIAYAIPKASFVSLKIFNILGQEVASLVNEELKPGSYEVTWDARQTASGLAGQFPSGVYFARMTAGDFMATKKVVLLR